MKKIISILMTLVLCMTFMVPTFAESSGMQYYTSNGVRHIYGDGVIPAYAFSSDNGNYHTVIIEEGITGIGESAFACKKNIKYVYLPSSCKSIGKQAFSCCSSLEEVYLKDGLQRIEWGAFSESQNLANIEIPATVSFIGESAFSNCHELTGVLHYTTEADINSFVFWDAKKPTIVLPRDVSKTFFSRNAITYIEEKPCFDVDPKYIKEESCLDVGPKAFINTNYVPKVNTRVVMDCEVNNQWAALFGTIYFGFGHYYHYYVNSDGAKFGSGFSASQSWAEDALVQTGRHTIELDGNVFKYNGISQTEHGGSELLSWGTPMYLFGIHLDDWTQTGDNQKIRFYSCKIYEGDNLVREFVPAKYFDMIGVYDRQEGKFYPKQGIGSMTVPSNSTASVISEGNVWIVAAIGAVAVIGAAAVVISKKKKKETADEKI